MKKVFTLMAIFATLAVAVCCNPSKGPVDDEEIDDEPEVTETISIDGQFADWAALTPGTFVSAVNNPESPWKGVEQIRVYADADFVYYYIKYNEETLKELLAVATEELPIRLCINTDGEFTTGYANYFLEAYDFIVEGALASNGAFTTYVGNFHQRIGSWVPVSADNIVTGMGSGSEYEIRLVREIFNSAANTTDDPKPMGDTFETGIRFYFTGSGEWAELSNMPNSSAAEGDGNGWGHLLTVTTNK